MDEKSHLRTKFKSLRRELDIKTISAQICEKIRAFDLYKQAANVMLFYPTKYEINLLQLLDDNKSFFFPRVNGLNLDVCPYSQDVEFKKSAYNINEPCSTPVSVEILDLIFVPALAADTSGYRLGYGGGFYDRFLPLCSNAVIVIPIFDEFVLNALPIEEFDCKVDYIITNVKRLTV